MRIKQKKRNGDSRDESRSPLARIIEYCVVDAVACKPHFAISVVAPRKVAHLNKLATDRRRENRFFKKRGNDSIVRTIDMSLPEFKTSVSNSFRRLRK